MNDLRNRIAFSTISCPEYTFPQMADAVQRYGYNGIELYALEGARLTPDILADRIAEARRALADTEIVSINSWGKLSTADQAERQKQEMQISRALELAVDLNCPRVKTFGGEIPAHLQREEVFAYMAESLRRLGTRASELGVTLMVETHDGFCLGSDLAELLARTNHPRIAALWDVHHPYRMGETPEETDHYIGSKVVHVHIKDAKWVDGAWKFVPLGEGELPVRHVLSLLMARDFAGYVTVDWEKMPHPEIAGPEQSLPHHISVLHQYVASAVTRCP